MREGLNLPPNEGRMPRGRVVTPKGNPMKGRRGSRSKTYVMERMIAVLVNRIKF